MDRSTVSGLEGLGQAVVVVGQIGGSSLTVAAPVGVHDVGVQGAAGDVGSGDVFLLLGQQVLEEGGTCGENRFQKRPSMDHCGQTHQPE